MTLVSVNPWGSLITLRNFCLSEASIPQSNVTNLISWISFHRHLIQNLGNL
jgi:hypothetical protein